jgi:hypothetical protein
MGRTHAPIQRLMPERDDKALQRFIEIETDIEIDIEILMSLHI